MQCECGVRDPQQALPFRQVASQRCQRGDLGYGFPHSLTEQILQQTVGIKNKSLKLLNYIFFFFNQITNGKDEAAAG